MKGNYTKRVEFTETNRYGCGPAEEEDAYTIEEFRECVDGGAFRDYDGHGYPAKDHMMDPTLFITPSSFEKYVPEDATHIVWFNR